MRFFKIFLLLLLITYSSAFSQFSYHSFSVKAGSYHPKNISNSYLIGGVFQLRFTDNIELGVGLDYFRRVTRDETTLVENIKIGQIKETEILTNSESSAFIIPVYAMITLRYPILFKHYYYITGTAGYNYLENKITVYQDEIYRQTTSYDGLRFSIDAGFIYRLNHGYGILAEISYIFSEASRKKTNIGAPVRAIVDISGIALRVGIRKGFY